jgi:carbon-monoxide dehydrogenase large subunit
MGPKEFLQDRQGRSARFARQEGAGAALIIDDSGASAPTSPNDSGEGEGAGGLHAAIVEVDVNTWLVRIDRYMVAEDWGVLINPAIVLGQIRAGVALGIGAVLLERSAYVERSGQYMSSTFMDYLLPTALEIPRIETEHLETVPPGFRHNFQGVGEGE